MNINLFNKRFFSVYLSLLLLMSSFNFMDIAISADDTSDDKTLTEYMFATKEELKTNKNFRLTDDGDPDSPVIRFGNTNSAFLWKIAGVESDDSLVLIGNPAVGETKFADVGERGIDQDCHYTGSDKYTKVFANHYSSSNLRKLLNDALKSNQYFSDAEKNLMKTSKIYTQDTKNDAVYYNEDKLYAPYGFNDTEYIIVGENKPGTLGNSAFQIKLSNMNSIWNNGYNFWLRTPGNEANYANFVHKNNNNTVTTMNVNSDKDTSIIAAFKMDISSVMFASIANESSTSDKGKYFYFRYNGSEKIKSEAKWTDDLIRVTKSPADKDKEIYLFIQGCNNEQPWTIKIKIDKSENIDYSNLQKVWKMNKEADLSKCKIWLELKEGNLRYAKYAKKMEPYKVSLGASLRSQGSKILLEGDGYATNLNNLVSTQVLSGTPIKISIHIDDKNKKNLRVSEIRYFDDEGNYESLTKFSGHADNGVYVTDEFEMPDKNITIDANFIEDLKNIELKLDEGCEVDGNAPDAAYVGTAVNINFKRSSANDPKISKWTVMSETGIIALHTFVESVDKCTVSFEMPAEDVIVIVETDIDKSDESNEFNESINRDNYQSNNNYIQEVGSGTGFVFVKTDSLLTTAQKNKMFPMKQIIKKGKGTAVISGKSTKLDISIEDIETSSILSQEQKDIFKNRDAISLDFLSHEKYGEVLSAVCDLGKNLADREFVVYYIYNGQVNLLTKDLKIDQDGKFKITTDHGATYILVSKTQEELNSIDDVLKSVNK